MKTLSEREQEILELASKDVTNELIYTELVDLITEFLTSKKAGNNLRDREEIASTMAGDIYMRMYKGEKFTYLLSFINKVHKHYVFNMYEQYRKLNITPSEYEEAMTVMDMSGFSEPGFRAVESVYLENIGTVIEQILKESCKYRLDSYIADNIRISMALSILRGRLVVFHLTEEQSEQLPLLITAFIAKVRTDLKGGCL